MGSRILWKEETGDVWIGNAVGAVKLRGFHFKYGISITNLFARRMYY